LSHQRREIGLSEVVLYLTAYLVLVGLMLGSFINLAADRIPKGESVVRPRSHCRACGRTLNVVDLLPVLGYFLRGGRCATCQAPIGITSPVVEAVSGGSMLVAVAQFGLWPGALVGFAVVAVWGVIVVSVSARWHPAEVAGPAR
jgi:leader peptidase (prepilin peptidase) / N-methyltransferase